VKNVLVLISSPAHPALNDGAIANAIEALRAQDATVGTPDWLVQEVACDIPFDGPSTGITMTALDGVVIPAAGRRKKLLVADMEST
jgi:phosphoserine phosphatase